ncbi:hypothetical protein MHU86_20808 [Fragilaria crotonensis]|nr:hypothetical protein MHU86_20808 [Fragilaria crotonensis]
MEEMQQENKRTTELKQHKEEAEEEQVHRGDEEVPEIATTSSTRHGARNQHRHKHFCKWIMDRFPWLTEGDLVMDVAGGKGELAARLAICHRLNVLLVDPRRANVLQTFQSLVFPKLPKKHQQRIEEKCREDPAFLVQVFHERFGQLEICFDESTLQSNHQLRDALQRCKLIIGMHSDGATEYIVNAALHYGKPFVVVPCCVFPNLFNQRFLINNNGEKIPVRTHAQFCEFLLEKDKRLRREILPFQGRNVAIVWNGQT